MKTIALSAYERPEYLSQTLAALADCRGISEYVLFVSVDRRNGEPPNGQVMELLASWHRSQIRVAVSETWLGCNRNMLRVLDMAFFRSEYVIGLEDDVVFARDALQWFEWARQFEQEAFAVCAMHLSQPGDLDAARLQPKFRPWGMATWRSYWPEMVHGWQRQEGPTVLSWDLTVDELRGDRLCVVPEVCRATNVGRLNGVHQVDGAPWVFEHVVVAEDCSQAYRLVS